jgi:hypothetical protein
MLIATWLTVRVAARIYSDALLRGPGGADYPAAGSWKSSSR